MPLVWALWRLRQADYARFVAYFAQVFHVPNPDTGGSVAPWQGTWTPGTIPYPPAAEENTASNESPATLVFQKCAFEGLLSDYSQPEEVLAVGHSFQNSMGPTKPHELSA